MSSQLLKTASPLLFLFVVFASAQVYDLGPHNIDDHGCLGCHVLHVPAANIETSDADVLTLWGKELNHLSYNAGGSEIGISETQINVPQDPIFHTTVCLACHDASIAKLGMVGSAFDTVGPIGPSFQEDGMSREHSPFTRCMSLTCRILAVVCLHQAAIPITGRA